MMHESLTLVFLQIRSGDVSLWDAFLEDLRDLFARQLRFRGIPEDVAEDVIQDSLALVYLRGDSLREPARLRAWLTSILLNRLRTQLSRPGVEEVSEACVAKGEGPLAALLAAEAGGCVRAWVEELPGTQRRPVELRLLNQRSPRETSEILGISQVCVRRRLHRAMANLRRIARLRGGLALVS